MYAVPGIGPENTCDPDAASMAESEYNLETDGRVDDVDVQDADVSET